MGMESESEAILDLYNCSDYSGLFRTWEVLHLMEELDGCWRNTDVN